MAVCKDVKRPLFAREPLFCQKFEKAVIARIRKGRCLPSLHRFLGVEQSLDMVARFLAPVKICFPYPQ